MKNKRGQFYIVAAVIIVLVLVGITSVKTYAVVSPEPRAIQDLGSELKEETSRIVDYGIYNTSRDLKSIITNFTNTKYAPYFLQKTDGTGIVFLYGNQTELEAVQYNQSHTGTISATIGTGVTNWNTVHDYVNRRSITLTGETNVSVALLNKTFNFDLQDNEMFYFVIVQEKEGETYVETNKP